MRFFSALQAARRHAIAVAGRGASISDAVWIAAALTIAVLVAIPLIAVLAALLTPGDEAWAHLVETTLWLYMRNTLALMVMVALIAGPTGVCAAWLIATTEFPGRRVFEWLLILPLAAPAYIIAYLYTDLFAFAGPVQTSLRAMFGWAHGGYWFPNVRSLPGAALCLALTLYPYVYLLTRTAFATQASAQLAAARTLGLGPWRAFRRVALPCARPAIAGGLALALMETMADYGVADYFAIPTFSTGIFRTWLAMGEKQAALKLAGAMLMLVAALVTIESLSRRGRADDGGRASAPLERTRLSPVHGALAALACALPVMFGFAVPVIVLVQGAMASLDQEIARGLFGYARNSVWAAGLAAVIATALASVLAYAQRKSRSSLTKASIRLATLGYALPGALLAVGLLGPLGGFDRVLTRMMHEHLGWTGGLVLTGSIAVLVYACVVRFLTVSFNTMASGMSRVPPELDGAARTLGAGPFGVFRRVHVPLLGPALGASTLLVFVDVMRELPATLLLRPFGFETLATRVYRLASDERLAEASVAALAIILVGLAPVIYVSALGRVRGAQAKR